VSYARVRKRWEVRNDERDDGTVLLEPETLDLMSLRASVRTAVKGVTVEAMDEAIRKSRGRG